MEKPGRLALFPVSIFAIILGLGGFTIAYQRAESLLGFPLKISTWLLWLTIGLYVFFVLTYLLKTVRHPKSVTREFHHPIKLNFFPTISIGLLLLSIATMKLHPKASFFLWVAGSILHLVLTLVVIKEWFHRVKLQIEHLNPAWFIPVVGNIIVPVAGSEHAPADISWFFFAVGLVFWLVLFTVVIYRMIFHSPLMEKLRPTLFILLAPPAIGMIALVKLTGALDPFSRILYFTGFFLSLLLLAQLRFFIGIRFFLSWWAYSFPMAAMTLSSTLMYHKTHLVFYKGAAYFFLTLLTVLIGLLTVRTIVAVRKIEICVED